MSKTLNVNIGILGHVDSGKTSLSKALSTISSTASFDKSPQSQERGITLDLGFSACIVDAPKDLQELGYKKVQYTLVDCPGHASLIRTIIGGAQIIDIMILVIDVQKGIQTQTAECIVIGEITADKLIVVLNKVDVWEMDVRVAKTIKMVENLNKSVFSKTKFKNPPMIAISVNPKIEKPIGIDALLAEFEKNIPRRREVKKEGMLMAVDHCFAMKGKGTIITGTILRGKLSVNVEVEIPTLGEKRKVKSIQMFKSPVDHAYQGDRVGVCITQLDSSKFERGFICDIGTVSILSKILCRVERIRFYREKIKNKSKLHVTVGHNTVMGTIRLFSSKDEKIEFDGDFNPNITLSPCDELVGSKDGLIYYCLIDLASPIPIPIHSKMIASKLDTDIHAPSCRLAFHGAVLSFNDFDSMKVYKNKEKVITIDRWMDSRTVLCKDLVKKGGDLSKYINLKVVFELGT